MSPRRALLVRVTALVLTALGWIALIKLGYEAWQTVR